MRWRVWISVAAQYTFLGPTTAPSDPLSSAVEEMAASFYDQQAVSWGATRGTAGIDSDRGVDRAAELSVPPMARRCRNR
jgi:hypothetical protein